MRALPEARGLPAVEVGTGRGALTSGMAGHFPHVTTWELDNALAAETARRLSGLANVTFNTGDFLTSRPPGEPFHLAGNVPYSITTEVVEWALAVPSLRTATFITQWEFARKRSGDYGRWTQTTVLSWPQFEWTLIGRIPRASFRPVPAVDAGILGLDRRREPLIPRSEQQRWERDVRIGFLGKGGSLGASLEACYRRGTLTAAFARAGLDPGGVVVAFVHPDQWVRLFTELTGAAPAAQPRRGPDHRPSSARRQQSPRSKAPQGSRQ